MKNLRQNIITGIVLVAIAIIAYTVGKSIGTKNSDTKLINNYTIIKSIAELASLEVDGTATYKTTNVGNDESWWKSAGAFFTEKTATITVPYQAKYGVDVSKDSIHITRQDSVVVIKLPATKLLSYELRIDRMETTNRKGLLVFSDDEFYNEFQKKLYAQSRRQMESNNNLLKSAQQRIDTFMQQYFQPIGLKVKCEFR